MKGKIEAGIVKGDGIIPSNLQNTYITPPGHGFLPREMAPHHQRKVMKLTKDAMEEVGVRPEDIYCLFYMKETGMGVPLQVSMVVVRVLSQLWKKSIIPMNHCIAHIEMGRLFIGALNPVILYANDDNNQVITYSKPIYRIFSETINIIVGDYLELISRVLYIFNDPIPNYNINQLAKKGQQFVEFPYAVKGMDVSFSGNRVEQGADGGSGLEEGEDRH